MTDLKNFWSGLPEGWQLYRNRFVFQERNERGREDLPLAAVSQRYGVLEKRELEAIEGRKLSAENDDLSKYKRICPGDLVYNKMRMWQGAVGVSGLDALVSPAYVVAQPKPGVDARFMAFLLKSEPYVVQSGLLSYGICDDQNSLRWEDFANLWTPLPPLEQQERIANFLEEQLGQIDALLAEKERLLGLLAEHRLSVCERVVADGGDRGRAKLGLFVDLLPGFAFPSDDFTRNPDDVPLLRGINVTPGALRWDETVFWKNDDDPAMERFRLRAGDVVFGMDRPWIATGARVAMVPPADEGALLLQRVCRLRGGNKLTQRFIYYALASDMFRQSIEVDLTGVSVPHISPEQILRFKVPVLSIEEQRARCTAADIEDQRIRELELQTGGLLQRLREYRSSLISAAVTGQLDLGGRKSWSEERVAA